MKQVLLLLPRGAESLEAAAFIDVFGWHQVVGSGICRLISCAATKEVELAFGQTMWAKTLIGDAAVEDYAALALPGGFGSYGYYQAACHGHFPELIRAFDAVQKPIAAICTAAIVLGEAGILAGRRATVYSREPQWARQLRAAGAIFEDAPLIRDGHIITSQNPASAVNVALELLGVLTCAEEAEHIGREMGFLSS